MAPRKRTVKLTDLVADPMNARTHGERSKEVLAESVRRHGAVRSIVVDETGKILAGHGMVEAAIANGMESVEVVTWKPDQVVAVQVDGWTEDQKRDYALADNRTAEASTWNMAMLQRAIDEGADVEYLDFASILMNGEDDDDTGGGGAEATDDVPEVDDDVVSDYATGQLWQLGAHRLLIGDSGDPEDVARVLLPDESIDMVWTDPPYGVSVGDKNKYLQTVHVYDRITDNLDNDTLDREELRLMLRAAFQLAHERCRPGAVWHVTSPQGPLMAVFGDELDRLGLWRQVIIWDKVNATMSPMGVDYHWKHEPMFHGWKTGAKHTYLGDRKQTTIWDIMRPLKSGDHPTTKPVALILRSLQHHVRPGEVVFDGFVGSGTTLVACEQHGAKCRAIEVSPRYAAVTIRRWEEQSGESAELINES